jgi:superfamily I DNA/RNA helicase
MQDYRRATPDRRQRIDAFIEKFDENAGREGTRLKMLKRQVDRRIRTARVDDGARAVLAHVGGDVYALLRATEHDEANAFAERVRLDINALTGLPRLITTELAVTVDGGAPDVPAVETPSALAHRSDDDLYLAGIPRAAIGPVRACRTPEELKGFGALLGAHDPMIELALEALSDRHDSIDEVIAKLLTVAGDGSETPEADQVGRASAETEPAGVPRYDTEDVEAAFARPGASEQFVVVDSSEELVAALRADFADWQIFLHPAQRRAAYERRYSGPARVSGGAGTGKTVVLVHRVKALLQRADAVDPPRILVTTYTDHLRADLRGLIEALLGPEGAALVEVETIDNLAQLLHEEMGGDPVEVLDATTEDTLWAEIAEQHSHPGRAATFLRNEYRHVILAQGVRTLDHYLTAPRRGRGVRLSERQRTELWPAFEAFTARTRGSGRRTVLQLTEDVAALFERAPADLYDHVLVDEAQDLHPAQWRLLRAVAPNGPDDLFIVGDAFQRIHGNHASLRAAGIETRGRSVRLRRNYRSTHEIVGWAVGVIDTDAVLDIDDHGAELTGYHSVRRGPAPRFRGFPDRPAEVAGIASAVRDWMDAGYLAETIAIAARTPNEVAELSSALRDHGLPAGEIDSDGRVTGAVNMALMHRLKGLEFTCVAVTGLSDGNVPHTPSICPPKVDPAQHRVDIETERNLVYVAATRARDQLLVSWSGTASPFLAPSTAQTGIRQ